MRLHTNFKLEESDHKKFKVIVQSELNSNMFTVLELFVKEVIEKWESGNDGKKELYLKYFGKKREKAKR